MDKIEENIMKRAMVVTVGTGTGENRKKIMDGLAEAIVTSICNHRPDKVKFMVSQKSLDETIPLIIPKLSNMECEYILLDDFNNLHYAYKKGFQTIQQLLSEGFSQEEIIIDYTSGTKAMSSGIVLAAISLEVGKISYISGKREKGIVAKGTEEYKTIKPIEILLQKKVELIIQLFNNYKYGSCISILKEMEDKISHTPVLDVLNELLTLSKAYELWDRFDHDRASEILLPGKFLLMDISHNKKFLGSLKYAKKHNTNSKPTENKELYLIADLLNNSQRRHEEGKYDDAIARLYRIFELLAQWEIKKMGICGEEDLRQKRYIIDISKLNDVQLTYFNEKSVIENKKIRIGLKETYDFLAFMDLPIGINFQKDKNLQNLLSHRNNSILAHGLIPIEEKTYIQLYSKCKEYLLEYSEKDIFETQKLAKFPTFDYIPSLYIE